MKFRQLFFYAFLFIATFANAQQQKKTNTLITNQPIVVEYIVDIVGVNTKQICLDIENNISKKEGVLSFKTVGFPSKYFVLKATKTISESDLRNWLLENKVKLTFFGGTSSLEDLYMNKKK